MSLILNIPEALLASVLSNWLTIVDVVRLDSAVCSHAIRDEFFRTAYRSGTTQLQYPTKLICPWETVCNAMNTWILARDVTVSVLFVSPVFLQDHEKRGEYLKRHGYAVIWVAYAPTPDADKDFTKYSKFDEDIAQYCSNLERFDGGDCHETAALLHLAQSFPQLQKVSRLGDGCTRQVVMALSRCCNKLRRVELTRDDLDEECLIALVRSNPGLVAFSAAGLGVSERFVRELAQSCCSLRDLEIRLTDLTLSSLSVLMRECENLASLRLEDSALLPTAGEVEYGVYANMRVLSFSNVDITEDELGNLLQACPGLTDLEVWNCQELLHSDNLPIGRRCPRLQRLSMFGNVVFAEHQMFVDISENCPLLRVLEIPHCFFVSATGLSAIAKQCHDLECVDIRGCAEVSDNFLFALAEHCPGLKILLLFECTGITGAGVEAVMAGCPGLVELGVEGCRIAEELAAEVKERYPQTRQDE